MACNNKWRFVFSWLVVLCSCSTTAKKNIPEFDKLHGKKVALVEIQGEPTARKIVEVALINQIVRKGTFQLVSKQEVDHAKTEAHIKVTDHKEIAKHLDADYALRLDIRKFDAVSREFYDAVEEEDSQLAAERGNDEGKTRRVFKVKTLDGHVQIHFEFIPTRDGILFQSGLAEAQDRVEVSAQKEAAHLPAQLSFMDKITQKAMQNFFDND